VRLVRDLLWYSWRLRRPGMPLLVVLVGLAALVALVLGTVAPLAIYPLL
jgi:hypothetical protein